MSCRIHVSTTFIRGTYSPLHFLGRRCTYEFTMICDPPSTFKASDQVSQKLRMNTVPFEDTLTAITAWLIRETVWWNHHYNHLIQESEIMDSR